MNPNADTLSGFGFMAGDPVPNRGVFDRYSIQRVDIRNRDEGVDEVVGFRAYGENEDEDEVFPVIFEYGDRIDRIPTELEEVEDDAVSVGVVTVDDTPIELLAANCGRDWPTWWGREREVFVDDYDDPGEGVTKI